MEGLKPQAGPRPLLLLPSAPPLLAQHSPAPPLPCSLISSRFDVFLRDLAARAGAAITCQSNPTSSAMRRATGVMEVERRVMSEDLRPRLLSLILGLLRVRAHVPLDDRAFRPGGFHFGQRHPFTLCQTSGARETNRREVEAKAEPDSALASTSPSASPAAAITAMALNTLTLSPGCAVTALRMPLLGASTSRVALSVSTENSGSPC